MLALRIGSGKYLPGSVPLQERVALNSIPHWPHRAEIDLGDSLILGPGFGSPVRALDLDHKFHSTAKISIATAAYSFQANRPSWNRENP